VSATLGGAIAIRAPDGREDKMAVFADAGIEDFAMLGDERCLLISRNGGVALLDLAAREVVRPSCASGSRCRLPRRRRS